MNFGPMKGFTRSMGSITVMSNVNGKPSKRQMGWEGKMETLKPNKANLEFHTDFNGLKNDLKLKNATLAALPRNPKFKQFLNKFRSRNSSRFRKRRPRAAPPRRKRRR